MQHNSIYADCEELVKVLTPDVRNLTAWNNIKHHPSSIIHLPSSI